MLNIDFIANLSLIRLSFDILIGRSNTGVLLALLIKLRKQHAFCEECNDLVCSGETIW